MAEYPIEEIAKGSNFRSVPAIVDILNNLRLDLPQAVSSPDAKGEARFFILILIRGNEQMREVLKMIYQ